MIVKENMIKIFIALTVLLYPFVFVTDIKASSPSFAFYPSGGIVKDREEGFTVDIMIDSGEYDITEARMVIKFDPDQIQLTKASRNNSLFEQWPEDESSLDNENGIVMLTGFTQSGSGTLYKTDGDPDLYARLEFEIVTDSEEDIVLDWEYSGSEDSFKSVIMSDGSPTYNVLTSKPSSATYRFEELTQTAIESKHIPFIVGGFLVLVAGIVLTSRPESTRKKYGTVVVYED